MTPDLTSAFIPETWPPVAAVAPVRAQRIHWLLAVPAVLPALLFPRRFGPHVAASGWGAAYAVHGACLIVAAALFVGVHVENQYLVYFRQTQGFNIASASNELTVSERLRQPLAALVLFLLSDPLVTSNRVAVLAVLLALGLAPWIGALVIMPFVAAGERSPPLYGRSVKLLLWSTACLLPLAAGVYAGPRVSDEWWEGPVTPPWLIVLGALTPIWWAWVVLRLGQRYAGATDGPGWQPRVPRCDGCGYRLTGLPDGGRCPECGRPVTESLPQRRTLPPFAAARGFRDAACGFLPTVRQALRARRFARGLAVRRGQEAARRFALLVCLAVGLCSGLGVASFELVGGRTFLTIGEDGPRRAAVYVCVGAAATCGALLWLGIMAAVVTRCGRREVVPRSIVVCYASAYLLVPALLAVLGTWAAYAATSGFAPPPIHLPAIGWIERDLLLWTVLLILLAPVPLELFHACRRVRWLLAETRFANG